MSQVGPVLEYSDESRWPPYWSILMSQVDPVLEYSDESGWAPYRTWALTTTARQNSSAPVRVFSLRVHTLCIFMTIESPLWEIILV